MYLTVLLFTIFNPFSLVNTLPTDVPAATVVKIPNDVNSVPSSNASILLTNIDPVADAESEEIWSFGDNSIKFVNHKLYSVRLNDDASNIEKLVKLREKIEIDFWNEPERNQKVNFRVSPLYQDQVEKFLNKTTLKYSIITNDLQKWIDKERAENQEQSDFLSGRQDSVNLPLDHYHTYQEIVAWMESLEKRYPSVVRVMTIGKTYENHEIKAIKLGIPANVSLKSEVKYGSANLSSAAPAVGAVNSSETQTHFHSSSSETKRKPALWLDAGIHAREWIAPATAVWIINELATKHETDDEVKGLLEKFDWYVLPVANPDGYIYTWWSNRLWRKNRALAKKAVPFRYPWALFDDCLGTDPNRNFDVDFGGASTSSNPCSDIFRGDSAFSEKETQAIRDTVLDLGKDLKIFISLHSYSQMWMFPWGYSAKKSPHHDDLSNLVLRVVLAVQKKHNNWYRHGPISTTIYPAAGSSPDWAHEKAGVKYSFIAELRDRGDHGFILPRQEIIPTAEETWEGIKVIAHEVPTY